MVNLAMLISVASLIMPKVEAVYLFRYIINRPHVFHETDEADEDGRFDQLESLRSEVRGKVLFKVFQ